MIKKVEAFFMKEVSEKAGRLAVFSLGLLVPFYQVRLIFIFLLLVGMLPSDIQHRRLGSLLALPFSRTEVFWASYLFLISVVVITQVIGGAVFALSSSFLGVNLLGSINFATAYFAIAMLSVMAGLDHIGIPFLVLIVDLILGGIGSRVTNVYFRFSPAHQGNVYYVLPIAFGLLVVAAILFSKRGVQK